ncbi:MAG: hypothetical protein DRO18_01220 [Thermoprotei archaeon]|nr:MAG: hypothetical protein DRO18_01220 [Thermoprotei archaeon]
MVRKHFKDYDPWNSSREEGEFWEEFSEEYGLYRYYSNEPLIDVRDEGNRIKVIMEASGSKEKDIRIERVSSKYVDVSLKHKGRFIRKRIEIQSKIKNAYLLKIKNGVAQIIIEKA